MCQDTWNLRHKFNFQGPALRILGFGVAISKSQGPISRVLGVKVPCPRVPVPWSWVSGSQAPRIPGLRVLGSQVSGFRVPGPRSQVLILDYANWILYMEQIHSNSTQALTTTTSSVSLFTRTFFKNNNTGRYVEYFEKVICF